jgi:integrase
MANKRHHIYPRGKIWYFRKGDERFSLETTNETETKRKRDQFLENYRLYGKFFLDEKVTDEETSSDSDPLFGVIVKEWARIHEAKVKHSTWRDYRSSMNTHVLPAFKDIPINEIKYQDVENFINNLGCGPKRVNNILVPMRSVFKYSFKAGYVKENVMLKVDNLPVEIPDIFPFTHNEVLKIIDCTEPYYRPYMKVRFYTGMRDGEINGLYWCDYKANMKPHPKIYINKVLVYGKEGKPKTKKSKRYIDCIQFAQDALKAQMQTEQPPAKSWWV